MSQKARKRNKQQETIRNISIVEIENDELSDNSGYFCGFCHKLFKPDQYTVKILDRLSSNNGSFCINCIRNLYHTRKSRDILRLSFRTIISHYYIEKYVSEKDHTKKMYLAQIKELIREHVGAGLINPLFSYDSETYIWFIDFSRVGRGPDKIKIFHIVKTFDKMLNSFVLKKHIPEIDIEKFRGKFIESILKFHHLRYRPQNSEIILPTFINCGIDKTKQLFSDKNFTARKLMEISEDFY